MIMHTLKPPFRISARLLPALELNGAWIQLDYDGCTSDGRTRYCWTIDLPDGSEWTDNDLKSGVGQTGLQRGFESLLAFLSACGESWPDGENADLFPQRVAEWANQNSDEIACLASDIGESDIELIVEG